MNKKIIIVIVFAAIIIGFLVFTKKKTNSDAGNDNSGSNNSNSSGNGLIDQHLGGGYYAQQEAESGKLDQNKIYITDDDLAYVVRRMHTLFDWTFSDNECHELCGLVSDYIFTRAEWLKLMQQDSYVTDRINSWVINDGKKWRYDELKKALKDNGVDYPLVRTRN